MDPDRLTDMGLQPTQVRLARLDDHRLVIGNKATLVAESNVSVYGSVMQLTPAELDQLYASDGVQDYQPQTVTVHLLDGGEMNAVTYLLPMHLVTGQNRAYASELATVAEKLNLPAAHIQDIKSWC